MSLTPGKGRPAKEIGSHALLNLLEQGRAAGCGMLSNAKLSKPAKPGPATLCLFAIAATKRLGIFKKMRVFDCGTFVCLQRALGGHKCTWYE